MSDRPASAAMTGPRRPSPWVLYGGLLVLSLGLPQVVPALATQLAFLWVMVLFALTWDLLGGQMGYNSFGNIVFFGVGAYVCAVVQRDSGLGYSAGLAVGMAAGAGVAVAFAALLGSGLLGLRGHYFAIATLGLGVAAGEIAAGIDYIGAGSGMVTPVYPGEIETRSQVFYYIFFALAAATFFTLRWLYSRQFGLAVRAIRDNEDKAEAIGLHTTRYKIAAWCVSAFFLALCGGALGNLVGFIDPRDVAFAASTYGVWMVLMAILGGSASIWGPVLGAVVFHITQELFWTYLLGWQRVALGLLIVLIVVFFPQGITGWLRERWPQLFGQVVQQGAGDPGDAA